MTNFSLLSTNPRVLLSHIDLDESLAQIHFQSFITALVLSQNPQIRISTDPTVLHHIPLTDSLQHKQPRPHTVSFHSLDSLDLIVKLAV